VVHQTTELLGLLLSPLVDTMTPGLYLLRLQTCESRYRSSVKHLAQIKKALENFSSASLRI